MNFLSNVLREEGGFEYKKAIVSAILALIQVQRGGDGGDRSQGGLCTLTFTTLWAGARIFLHEFSVYEVVPAPCPPHLPLTAPPPLCIGDP